MIYWHGNINKVTYDSNGDYTSVPVVGYHCNSTEPLEGCESYLLAPDTPYMQALGVESYYYVFSNKDEFLSVTGFVE